MDGKSRKTAFTVTAAVPIIVMLVYAIVCAVRVGRGDPFWAMLLCLPNPLFMWLFYMMKLRKSAAD